MYKNVESDINEGNF